MCYVLSAWSPRLLGEDYMRRREFSTLLGDAPLTRLRTVNGLLLIGVVLVSSRRRHGFDWLGLP
jgi:hypothetical protein